MVSSHEIPTEYKPDWLERMVLSDTFGRVLWSAMAVFTVFAGVVMYKNGLL